jgi:ABC-type sugar transport system permease subunit
MQIYDIIVATTGGGPGYHTEVPITRILTNMTGYGRFGYACAMGLVFGVLLLVVSLGQLRLSRYMKRT